MIGGITQGDLAKTSANAGLLSMYVLGNSGPAKTKMTSSIASSGLLSASMMASSSNTTMNNNSNN